MNGNGGAVHIQLQNVFGEVVPAHHQGWTPALTPESRTQGTEGFERGPKAMGSVGEFDEEKSPSKKGFQQTAPATGGRRPCGEPGPARKLPRVYRSQMFSMFSWAPPRPGAKDTRAPRGHPLPRSEAQCPGQESDTDQIIP